MGCRQSTSHTRGGAALRPKPTRVRAASRVVRDSASSLESGQRSAETGSPDVSGLEAKRENAEATNETNETNETHETNDAFAARSKDSKDSDPANPSSVANARSARPAARLARGVPGAPSDDRVARPEPKALKALKAFRTDAFEASDDDEAPMDETEAETFDAEPASAISASNAFDGTEARRATEDVSSRESLDELLRETRALLNRAAPGRVGTDFASLRESVLGVDDAVGLDLDARGVFLLETRPDRVGGNAVKVPVLEAFDEENAPRKKTRGGGFANRAVAPPCEALANRRLAVPRPKAALITARQSSAGETRARGDRAEGANVSRSTRRALSTSAAASAASPTPTTNVTGRTTRTETAPFERTRRRFAERTARVSGSSVASSPPRRESRAALDGGTRRPPAAATRKKGSAARPARASLSHGRTVSASAGRARRLEDVLAAYRLRESSVPETFLAREACRRADLEKSDENVPFRHAMRDEDASSPSSSRAQSSERCSKARVVTDRVEGAASLRVRSVASPTVRATPLTSGAPKRTVAPMSDKMRRARGALRALQIPGAEPAAPRHARAAAKVERVSPAATFAMA